MNKEQYLKQRNELLEKGQQLINEGKFEEFNSIKEEVEKLDHDFENAAQMQANLNALKDSAVATNLQNISTNVKGSTVATMGATSGEENMTNSIEYRKAFMNYALKGTAMPAEFMNADANTKTTDAGVMIPETVLQKTVRKDSCINGAKVVKHKVRDRKSSVKGGQHTIK